MEGKGLGREKGKKDLERQEGKERMEEGGKHSRYLSQSFGCGWMEVLKAGSENYCKETSVMGR